MSTSWEPVGRQYDAGLPGESEVDPRGFSPTPSVVAPEAPAYETLESFRSVETTFRYRYRLTATSRATGLSSSYGGGGVRIGQSSGRVLSIGRLRWKRERRLRWIARGRIRCRARMDYDEDSASIAWEWEGLWGASTALLECDGQVVSRCLRLRRGVRAEAYHYIASMTSQASGVSRTARRSVRVTVTVVGERSGRWQALRGRTLRLLSRKAGRPAADRHVTSAFPEIYEAFYRHLITITSMPCGYRVANFERPTATLPLDSPGPRIRIHGRTRRTFRIF